jgi:hypothetical protein
MRFDRGRNTSQKYVVEFFSALTLRFTMCCHNANSYGRFLTFTFKLIAIFGSGVVPLDPDYVGEHNSG